MLAICIFKKRGLTFSLLEEKTAAIEKAMFLYLIQCEVFNYDITLIWKDVKVKCEICSIDDEYSLSDNPESCENWTMVSFSHAGSPPLCNQYVDCVAQLCQCCFKLTLLDWLLPMGLFP